MSTYHALWITAQIAQGRLMLILVLLGAGLGLGWLLIEKAAPVKWVPFCRAAYLALISLVNLWAVYFIGG